MEVVIQWEQVIGAIRQEVVKSEHQGQLIILVSLYQRGLECSIAPCKAASPPTFQVQLSNILNRGQC